MRPVILLDGDNAGRVRRDALITELYEGQENAVLILSDVIGKEECEIEDIIGEETILPILRAPRKIGKSKNSLGPTYLFQLRFRLDPL